jgi:ankyrin repeat protein
VVKKIILLCALAAGLNTPVAATSTKRLFIGDCLQAMGLTMAGFSAGLATAGCIVAGMGVTETLKAAIEKLNIYRLLQGSYEDRKNCCGLSRAQRKQYYAEKALINAIQSRDVELVNKAINSGSDVKRFRFLLYDSTPLLYACHQINDKSYSVISALMDAGAQINAQDLSKNTPLFTVCASLRAQWSFQQASLVGLLLNAGANANAQNINGETPLLAACRIGASAEVIKLLCNQGKADVNLASDINGETPLLAACRVGASAEVIELLCNQGKADVNLASKPFIDPDYVGFIKIALTCYNQTPLMAACERRDLEAVKILLAHGADVTIKNSAGKTAFDMFGDGIEDLLGLFKNLAGVATPALEKTFPGMKDPAGFFDGADVVPDSGLASGAAAV